MKNNLITVEEFVNRKPKQSFLMFPQSVGKIPEYQRWRGTARGSIASYLIMFIIRGGSQNPITNKIFEDFYLDQKLLVTRFSDDDLAKRLGYKGKKSISGYLKTLEQEGIFKVGHMYWNNTKVKLYNLGYYTYDDSESGYSETLYVYKKFFTLKQEKNILTFGEQKQETESY